MEDCIFCQIARGKSSAKIEYQDDQCIVFHDIHPNAPIHLLIVTKKHLSNLNDVGRQDQDLLGHLLLVAKQVAESQNLNQRGYRLVINNGPEAGQVVNHLHLHLLGGASLGPIA